jgi:rare lipoprotein A (peptidoglycan hydrolase)
MLIQMRIATMRAKLFVMIEAVFLALGLLVLTPTINPTPNAMTSPTPQSTTLTGNPATQKVASSKKGPQPIATWECLSSWYGEDFDGLPTATGETYDMYGDTAAHPTLPLGSIVRVTNTRNHRSQIVRINDRGPYVEGRELDVSYAVAEKLGFDQRGTAKVRLELLEVPKRPVTEHHN